ncbi:MULTISPECIES: toxin HicA [unclassified Rhodococcus (in: high G+C Gram-positive bacteria)]|uniref:toxin HicA n=1 Tax=unclassified Rhodococcus (in: high G+C Gram-positive bacteria) TaxID=192944 RepID=UPI0033968441
MLETSLNAVRYAELIAVCVHLRIAASAGHEHAVFSMPWEGGPRVNFQEGSGGSAQLYQVKQVVAALKRPEEQSTEEEQ